MDELNRGDLLTIAMQGDYGKPRPALVIQADYFRSLPSVTVLPMTSTIVEAPLLRVDVHPDGNNGLHRASQVIIDKTLTVKLEKIGSVFGYIQAATMLEIERRLAVFLGIAK